jgi:hypothetical protein
MFYVIYGKDNKILCYDSFQQALGDALDLTANVSSVLVYYACGEWDVHTISTERIRCTSR